MLKGISNLDGFKKLSKNDQQSINGSRDPNCGWAAFCDTMNCSHTCAYLCANC